MLLGFLQQMQGAMRNMFPLFLNMTTMRIHAVK